MSFSFQKIISSLIVSSSPPAFNTLLASLTANFVTYLYSKRDANSKYVWTFYAMERLPVIDRASDKK